MTGQVHSWSFIIKVQPKYHEDQITLLTGQRQSCGKIFPALIVPKSVDKSIIRKRNDDGTEPANRDIYLKRDGAILSTTRHKGGGGSMANGGLAHYRLIFGRPQSFEETIFLTKITRNYSFLQWQLLVISVG